MDVHSMQELLAKIDGTGSAEEFAALKTLEEMGKDIPELLMKLYTKSSNWKVRSSCTYHSIRYARISTAAKELGVLALADRSKIVRYRACMLLAYSLDEGAIRKLKEHSKLESDEETREHIAAAIDAIQNRNSDYFLDRKHTGKVRLNVHGARL